jgi:hypothetical protein
MWGFGLRFPAVYLLVVQPWPLVTPVSTFAAEVMVRL